LILSKESQETFTPSVPFTLQWPSVIRPLLWVCSGMALIISRMRGGGEIPVDQIHRPYGIAYMKHVKMSLTRSVPRQHKNQIPCSVSSLSRI
jgi:hypothetical protein